MSRRLSWRRLVGEQLYDAAPAAAKQAPPFASERWEAIDKLAAEQRKNTALRLRIRELEDQVRAGRLLLDAALKGCDADCAHAELAAGQRVQLHAMQTRLDEVQAFAEAEDRTHIEDVLFVPEQRGRRT